MEIISPHSTCNVNIMKLWFKITLEFLLVAPGLDLKPHSKQRLRLLLLIYRIKLAAQSDSVKPGWREYCHSDVSRLRDTSDWCTVSCFFIPSIVDILSPKKWKSIIRRETFMCWSYFVLKAIFMQHHLTARSSNRRDKLSYILCSINSTLMREENWRRENLYKTT